ncbi:Peptide methionine sulfoxide reductase MsrB [Pseudoalteromonas luteoviolacea B = ATCC 29581]|nr:Peptide methionine sulfoxide reductase MsrB [Pseudoalteromonas luteoviolacea B = ATCC 29581]
MLTWQTILKLAKEGNHPAKKKVTKSEREWQALLPEDVFRITRLKGTERPFSSQACTVFTPGEYHCVCCNTLLFDANEKFDSRSGWPSFTQPAEVEAIAYLADHSHGMTRVEIVCNVCDAHLGHVFPDGPPSSGLRYCVNALSLVKNESE